MTKTRKQLLTQTSRKCPLEYDECLELVDWLNGWSITYVHIPNEGLRSVIEGQRLGKIGLHKGFSDYLVFASIRQQEERGSPGVALEMKRLEGSDFSDEQQEWLDRMEALGWDSAVGYGAQDAIEQLQELGYGLGPS
jgi:hypothetical protein